MATTSFKKLPIPSIVANSNLQSQTVSLDQLNNTHRVINTVQSNVAEALQPVLANPVVSNGQLLTNVVLTAGQANIINHMLGQTLQGWFVSRPQGFSMLYEDQNNSLLDKQVIIWTYIDTIVDLFVF